MSLETSSAANRIANLNSNLIQKIVTLRQQGRSYRKIGAAVGLSHGSVMRVVEWQETGRKPKPWQPRLPKRPRNGHNTLPDFERVADLEAGGYSIRDAWLDYAQSNSAAYSYAYFSTLYRVWLDDRQKRPSAHGNASNDASIGAIPDYSADEDHRSELYWKRKADPRSQIHVLSGYDCSLKVKNGELLCYDTGAERSFPKVTHGLSAIIFLGTAGQISVDAIKWCAAQGIGICVIGWHGELISVLSTALLPNDKIGDTSTLALRRAQFRADPFAIAKAILMQKTHSQHHHGKLSAATAKAVAKQIKIAHSLTELLTIEAQAALEYWDSQRFTLRHKKRNWPLHWTQFTYRASAISGRPRYATHPVNAILNYAYSIVAAQITRSLAAHGLDPACGFLHADAPGRYSLTYDVMELLRAEIDAKMFAWIKSHSWKRPDFPVTPEGVVRLQPTLAAVVAQKTALPQRDVDRAIAWLADVISHQAK